MSIKESDEVSFFMIKMNLSRELGPRMKDSSKS